MTEALQQHDVHQIALFWGPEDLAAPASEHRADRVELVREDLVRRIDHDVISLELLGMELPGHVLHEVDHHTLLATTQNAALEPRDRSEEHTSLQSRVDISYAVFCL